jgi:hypothetical protein
MHALTCRLMRPHKVLVAVALSGVVVAAFPATAFAQRPGGRSRGQLMRAYKTEQSQAVIRTCNPKHFPSGGVCWSPLAGAPKREIESFELKASPTGGRVLAHKQGGLVPNQQGQPATLEKSSQTDLVVPISLGFLTLLGAGLILIYGRTRAL